MISPPLERILKTIELMVGDWGETVLRMTVAMVASGLIGWDRQRGGRPAGLRTHMLVGLGAALVVSIPLGGGMADASRAVQGVATGIGFLCAGDILHHVRDGNERVKGLTSSAALWVSAALGMVAAVGAWRHVVIGTVGTLVILIGMRPVERFLVKEHPPAPEPPGAPEPSGAADKDQ
ncbi:MAG TPA: MgtC/SapB family protein [Polyangia bacterium]|nr:MgtC/SapB family protein [Polyangia bacterium]